MCEEGTLYSVDTSNSVRTFGAFPLIGRLPSVRSLDDGYGGFFHFSVSPSTPSEDQHSTNVLHLFTPICPISQSTPTNQINAHRIPSVFGTHQLAPSSAP